MVGDEVSHERVRSDLECKKLFLMRGRFVAALAAESTASLPWMPLWLGTQTKVMERGMEDRVAKRVRMRPIWYNVLTLHVPILIISFRAVFFP